MGIKEEVLEKQGIKVIVEMPLGIPAQALHDLAEKHDVAAIIIGSHGWGVRERSLKIVVNHPAAGAPCSHKVAQK